MAAFSLDFFFICLFFFILVDERKCYGEEKYSIRCVDNSSKRCVKLYKKGESKLT